MTQIYTLKTAQNRVMAALIAGLEQEFGRGAGEALAHRFLAAEEADILWEARASERWLGSYGSADDDDELELDRIAILARLGSGWFAAQLIVDGDGRPHGVLGRRRFDRADRARRAFAAMR